MAATLRLRCQLKTGLLPLDGLMTSSTVADLLTILSNVTSIPKSCMQVRIGYPPMLLELSNVDVRLSELQLQSGDKLIVDEVLPTKQNSKYSSHNNDSQLSCSVTKSDTARYLQRRIVPADNSCLFTSIHAVMTDGTVDTSHVTDLRQTVAGVVASDPVTYTDALLGQPNADYVNWIQKCNSWGGALEISIFSDFYQTEIVVVDCSTGCVSRFGEDKDFSQRVFLIFDGVHYDFLVNINGSNHEIVRFSVDDDVALQQAAEIGHIMKQSKQYTDVSGLHVICLICRSTLVGERGILVHSQSTGHDRYGEYSSSSIH